ncbi:hypothetical protein BH09BAC3_BH09BAC3_06830 [soil metagenome]
MRKLKPYSASFLTLSGFLLIALGIYFIFLRPPLLPEDQRYVGSTLSEINGSIPALSLWLQKVFWVMGGYVLTSGLFTLYFAKTSFHTRTSGAFTIALLTGLSSIGWMTAVNFILLSDFRWVLLTFTTPWIISLMLYARHQ